MIQVKLEGTVVELDVGDLRDNFFELRFFPCLRGVTHHCDHHIVILLILVIQEHQLWPQVGLLSCSENLKMK